MTKIEFDKIHVTLIEDNPLQFDELFSTEGKIKLTKHGKSVADNFEVKLFQHPVEVKEFIENYTLLLDRFTWEEIGLMEGVVPEVIVFDYKLSENLTIDENIGSIHYNKNTEQLRKKINPNYLIQSKLQSRGIKRDLLLDTVDVYSKEMFIDNINGLLHELSEEGKKDVKNNDIDQLNDDELGLYCGIAIWKMFNDYPAVCIPATHNKEKIEKLNTHSKFYEWLYAHEFSEMFLDTNRRDKTWDKILPKAMKHFRNRLLDLAKRGKLSFDLENLLKISSITDSEKLDEEPLKVSTLFGTKKYHLGALFIDCEEDELLDKIKQFVEEDILKGVLDISDFDSFNNIKRNFIDIWDFYKEKFETVAFLSSLYTENKTSGLNPKKESILKKLLSEFTLNRKGNNHLQPVSAFEVNLSTSEKRLLFYCLCINAVLQFNLNKNVYRIAKNKSHYVNFEILSDEDFSYIASPLYSEYTSDPYCLEMHIDAVTSPNNRLYRTNQGLKKLNIEYNGETELNDKIWLAIVSSIKPSEKHFVRYYFHNTIEKYKNSNYNLPSILL